MDCAVCPKVGLMACARCQDMRYCGKECQEKDWETHASVCCRAPAEGATAAAAAAEAPAESSSEAAASAAPSEGATAAAPTEGSSEAAAAPAEGSSEAHGGAKLLGDRRGLEIMARMPADDLEYTITSMDLPAQTEAALRERLGDIQRTDAAGAIEVLQRRLAASNPGISMSDRESIVEAPQLGRAQLEALRDGARGTLIIRGTMGEWRVSAADPDRGTVHVEKKL